MRLLRSYCDDCDLALIKSVPEYFCPNCDQNMEVSLLPTRNPSYRRNSDENLRQAERQFQMDPREETFETLNRLRERMGLAPLVDPRSRLEVGYRWGIPFGVEVAWGSRAILNDRGADMVYKHSIGSQDEIDTLIERLNSGMVPEMQNQIRLLLRHGKLRGDEDRGHLLAEKDGVVILGNTQGSHGYLYLVAFEKPVEWTSPEKYMAPPPPPPPPPYAPSNARRVYSEILNHYDERRGAEELDSSKVEQVMHRASILLTAKTGAKTPKAFFGWLTKQRLKPGVLETLETALKSARIKYYS